MLYRLFYYVLYTLCIVWYVILVGNAIGCGYMSRLISIQTVEGMLARALHFNGILVSTCRHLGIFNGQSAHHDLGNSPFALWLAQEQLHR
jgi:hypothetical protein